MLKVCSWNIFMKDYNFKWRIEEMCKKILLHNPDVICFQEVIPAFFDIIKNNLLEYSSAFIHPYQNNTTARPYGEVILSKLPIIAKGFDTMKSGQGRVNSWIEIEVDSVIVRINTAHLESTESHTEYCLNKAKNIRQEQLAHIKSINKSNKHWLWIGDTNLMEDENHEMYNSNVDTYFSNRFRKGEYRNSYNREYDKVWVNNINIVNFNSISGVLADGLLSDHDGLIVECSF